uniref:KIAA0040 n=1 Tax=Rhabditophanes sp. KR3021 TaxID=114890 RepID=A0AC35THW9_9BILA
METAEEKETKNIFILGVGVLCLWIIVIFICASPQLLKKCQSKKWCCCSNLKETTNHEEKIKAAQERVRSASKSFLSHQIAGFPSAILLQQVMGNTAGIYSDVIVEVC